MGWRSKEEGGEVQLLMDVFGHEKEEEFFSDGWVAEVDLKKQVMDVVKRRAGTSFLRGHGKKEREELAR